MIRSAIAGVPLERRVRRLSGLRLTGSLALGWLALACTSPTHATVEPETEPTEVARTEAPVASTRERLSAWMVAQEVGTEPDLSAEDLAAARAAGLSADELVEFLLPVLANCQTEAGCVASEAEADTDTDYMAMALLLALDDPRGHQLVGAIALFEGWRVAALVDAATERRVAAVMETKPCVAPQPDEIAAAQAGLADFRVFDQRANGKLRARKLAPDELDDLAYFMAAVAESGASVGETWREDHKAVADPKSKPALVAAAERWRVAISQADLELAYAAGTEYVELLGWPGPIQIASEIEFAWGGARHSYLLRDMAQIAELLGEFEQAELLWTRANPGGGMCGTSRSSNWIEQVRGYIRSAEAVGNCRATVAVRLLDLGADDSWGFGPGSNPREYADGFDYGVRRLASAGFDLGRLYRGAVLTRNRDGYLPGDLSGLEAALTGPDRELAGTRLWNLGTEAWAGRIHAIEGLADTLGEAGLEPLFELIAVGDASTRARAITAIGNSARRMAAGPCDPDLHGGGGQASSAWYRVVRPFGFDCATRLDDAEIAQLSRRLVPHLRDADPQIRVATATALSTMLAVETLDTLRAQLERERKRVARTDQDAWVVREFETAIAAFG